MRVFFFRILTQGVEAEFVDPLVLFIDSTHSKANANKWKYKKKFVRRAAQQYKKELDQEVNKDRILHRKKPFTSKKKKVEEHETKESTTDLESGYYVKKSVRLFVPHRL